MAPFCRGVPRLLAVAIVVAGFCLLPPEALSRGPGLCTVEPTDCHPERSEGSLQLVLTSATGEQLLRSFASLRMTSFPVSSRVEALAGS
jgi:hypothetical protein